MRVDFGQAVRVAPDEGMIVVFSNQGQVLQLVMASISALASVIGLVRQIWGPKRSTIWLLISSVLGLGSLAAFRWAGGDQRRLTGSVRNLCVGP